VALGGGVKEGRITTPRASAFFLMALAMAFMPMFRLAMIERAAIAV
jgi:hypothetical protein